MSAGGIGRTREAETRPAGRSITSDRIARYGILGSGILCLLLLAWGHLGLGVLIFPPAPTVALQTATAGTYEVTLRLDSGQLTADRHNTVSFEVRDHAGRLVKASAIHVQPVMTTMTMDVPAADVTATAGGRYLAHPVFSMAGPWRLDVSITAPGQRLATMSFNVGVRWG
jgi:YtkA-like protein